MFDTRNKKRWWSCRSHLYDFRIQRQCATVPMHHWRGRRNKSNIVSKLPQLTFSAPQPEIMKKVTKQTPWKLGRLSGGCATALLSSVHTGASSASSKTLLCCGFAPASPVSQQPLHLLCQFSTTVNLILSLLAQWFVVAFWRKNRSWHQQGSRGAKHRGVDVDTFPEGRN